MTYPFVQAHHDYGRRKGPVRAFVIHMAEGGGTVGFLSRPNRHGVSVHYVVERGGRVVQMLKESHASGSIRPSAIRVDDDPSGIFGATFAKGALGSWWRDPNSAVLSVEVEGFAKKGPRPEQVAALIDLVADLRSRHPGLCLLGHRDFQRYKACPGRLIDWSGLGGHGPGDAHAKPAKPKADKPKPKPKPKDPTKPEPAPAPAVAPAATPKEAVVKAFRVPERPTLAQIKADAWLHQRSDLRPDPANVQLTDRTPEQLRLPYVGAINANVRIVAYERVGPPDPDGSSLAMFVETKDIEGFLPG